jgi:hypothetical protein
VKASRPVGAFSERRATQKAVGQRRRNQRGRCWSLVDHLVRGLTASGRR